MHSERDVELFSMAAHSGETTCLLAAGVSAVRPALGPSVETVTSAEI